MNALKWTLPEFLDLIRRRFVWIVPPACCLAVILIVIIRQIPDMFQSSAVMMLEPKSVPNDMVRNIIQDETAARLNAIKQTVLSRGRLEELIRAHDLYPAEPGKPAALMDQRVSRLRDDIEIEILGREEQSVTFQIRFNYPDPDVVTSVTRKLSSLFMDFDYRLRLGTIDKTAAFFKEELRKTESKMKAAQQRLAQFKSMHNNELPEQLEVNLRTLEQVQQQLLANGESIDRMEAQKLELDRQLAATPRTLPSTSPPGAPGVSTDETLLAAKRQELETLKSQLADLLNRYTAAHPDVVAANRRLQILENEIADLSGRVAKTAANREEPLNPVWLELTAQSQAANTELRIRKKERETLEQQRISYAARVANTPLREQEIESTRREYQALLQEYETMQRNLADTTLSRNLEGGSSGEQFRILDPPSRPQSAMKPNRPVLITLGILASLMFGLGLGLAREITDGTIHSKAQLRKALHLPVLASIGHYVPRSQRRRVQVVRWISAALVVLFFTAVTYAGLTLAKQLDLAVRFARYFYKL